MTCQLAAQTSQTANVPKLPEVRKEFIKERPTSFCQIPSFTVDLNIGMGTETSKISPSILPGRKLSDLPNLKMERARAEKQQISSGANLTQYHFA